MLGFLHKLFINLFVGNSLNLRVERQSCCEAIGSTGNCAAISGNGQPLYTLCSSPRKHFFWDMVHPSDHGWKLVSKILFKKWKQIRGVWTYLNHSNLYNQIGIVSICKWCSWVLLSQTTSIKRIQKHFKMVFVNK